MNYIQNFFKPCLFISSHPAKSDQKCRVQEQGDTSLFAHLVSSVLEPYHKQNNTYYLLHQRF